MRLRTPGTAGYDQPVTYAGNSYEPALRWAYLVWIAAMLAAWAFLKPKPVPLPDKSVVLGCYTTESAPPINVGTDGLTIMQTGARPIGFRLDRTKTGIELVMMSSLKAEKDLGRYRFAVGERHGGWYLRFATVINGRWYPTFETSDPLKFTFLTEDGAYLIYERISAAPCSTTPV